MGASLGPSFGLVVMGGGFGSWLVGRLGKKSDEEEARQGFALTGMAGGMGGGYSAPLFATVLASELSPTTKKNYVAAFIPELFTATLGFVIYYGITGSSMLGSYRLPEYKLQLIDLLTGVLLGILAVFVLLLHNIYQQADCYSSGFDQKSIHPWSVRWSIGWPNRVCTSTDCDCRKQTVGD